MPKSPEGRPFWDPSYAHINASYRFPSCDYLAILKNMSRDSACELEEVKFRAPLTHRNTPGVLSALITVPFHPEGAWDLVNDWLRPKKNGTVFSLGEFLRHVGDIRGCRRGCKHPRERLFSLLPAVDSNEMFIPPFSCFAGVQQGGDGNGFKLQKTKCLMYVNTRRAKHSHSRSLLLLQARGFIIYSSTVKFSGLLLPHYPYHTKL
jgi:hypothetical protein